jgi:ketol-acid reductoisomerase
VKGADLVMILLPDENIGQVYRDDIEPNIKKGAALAFAHGFNIHYGQVAAARRPRRDHDRAEGPRPHWCARPTSQGGGVPSLIAVHQERSARRATSPCPTRRPTAARAAA